MISQFAFSDPMPKCFETTCVCLAAHFGHSSHCLPQFSEVLSEGALYMVDVAEFFIDITKKR